MAQRGRPRKHPATEEMQTVTLRLPAGLHASLRLISITTKAPMNDLLTRAAAELVEHHFAGADKMLTEWIRRGRKGFLWDESTWGEEPAQARGARRRTK